MTPLEVGLLGGGFLCWGATLVGGPTPRGLWGAAGVVPLVGGLLVWCPGNLWVLDWVAPTGGALALEGGPAGDFKFLTLGLTALAGVAYLGGTTSTFRALGWEPLLIGLIAVVAGLVTFGLDNLVLLYLGLELQALCLYTLVGFFKFQEERTDSALRYLLSGSLVSGFMLVGFARLYGTGGTFQLGELPGWDPWGSTWVTGVLLFKVGAAPFHFWTPLVYTPLEWGTLGLALGAAKVNIWYLWVANLGGATSAAWWPAWWAGLASVGVGCVGGFFQTNLGGLLAYSGVINGGYLVLLAQAPGGAWWFAYYAGVYLTGTLTLVGVVSLWGDTRTSTLGVWNKLGVGLPLVVYYLALNLGGLPVFPGFFGKLALLQGLSPYGVALLWGLVAASVVPAVYYVGVSAAGLFTSGTPTETVLPGRLHPGGVIPLVLGLNGVTTLVGAVLM